jgi:hypothetical protein
MARLSLHAGPRRDVGIVDADDRGDFVLVAVQKRIGVADAEGANREVGFKGSPGCSTTSRNTMGSVTVVESERSNEK